MEAGQFSATIYFRRKLDIFSSNWDMCLSMIKERKKER